ESLRMPKTINPPPFVGYGGKPPPVNSTKVNPTPTTSTPGMGYGMRATQSNPTPENPAPANPPPATSYGIRTTPSDPPPVIPPPVSGYGMRAMPAPVRTFQAPEPLHFAPSKATALPQSPYASTARRPAPKPAEPTEKFPESEPLVPKS